MLKKTIICLLAALGLSLGNIQAQTPSKTDKNATPKTSAKSSRGKRKAQAPAKGEANPKQSPSNGGTIAIERPTDGGGKGKPSLAPEFAAELDTVFRNIVNQGTPVVRDLPNGQTNYSEQFIEAKGSAVIDTEKFKNPAQARLMAERGAIVVAQRNLLEIAKGVNVIGETTVQDMITTGDFVYTRVEGVVKGAKQFGPSRENNGAIEVTLRMPMFDEKNGLSAGFNPSSYDNMRRINGMENAPELANIAAAATGLIDGENPLLFNLGGKQIDPSMFPVIFDENNKVLLDFSKIYQQTGKVPKVMGLSKELLQSFGNKKGVEIIDLIQNAANGKITLADPLKKSKINWAKIGNISGKVGKILLNILL
ncbi:MAG: LPP20 family lipoprotein [Bacteroidia bacterium]|jgi:hypothetical protein